MSIVISYAHENSDFVEELAANLFKNRVPVWVDRWELKVGDSILGRIQEAIEKAEALIVVLSKASVVSEWCKKELNSGLLKELEEKSIFVLPVIIEDCDIPLFLRDKLHADFRKGKKQAFDLLVEATARFTTDTLKRTSTPTMNTDYGLWWGLADDRLDMNLTFLDMPLDQPYSVITEIIISCNQTLAKRYEVFSKSGFDWYQRLMILSTVSEAVEKMKATFLLLEDSNPKLYTTAIRDQKRNISIGVHVSSRRLGQDTGKDIVVDWGLSLKNIVSGFIKEKEKLPTDAQTKLLELIKSTPF